MKSNNRKPLFEVETVTISSDEIIASYYLNDEEILRDAVISFPRLKEFVIDMGMNSYCENVFTGDYKEYHIDTYITENLEEVVKYFLESTHDPFEAIITGLDAMIVDIKRPVPERSYAMLITKTAREFNLLTKSA